MDDWKKEIAVAHLVKQKLAEVDVEEIWPFHLPEIAASEETLRHVEHRIGEPLDASYRAFLVHADGWDGFAIAVDLFGTRDLIGGPRKERAERLLDALDGLEEFSGVNRHALLPIGVSSQGIDVFAIARRTAPTPGEVFWLAGSHAERFANFKEFFLTMVDHNREEARELQR